MGDKERMVWSPVWLNVLQTIVWLPFKSHTQSSFDKSVLLSNPHSKMVGFCFGLAIPTLVWYTTLISKHTRERKRERKKYDPAFLHFMKIFNRSRNGFPIPYPECNKK